MKKAILLLGIAAFFSTAILLFLILRPKDSADFVPPPHEDGAILGIPTPEERYHYADGPTSDAFAIKFATAPILDDGAIVIYLTNPAENRALLRFRICCGEELIAESGYLRPGEYLRALDAPNATAGQIRVKVMSYEEDTWYSLGAYTIALPLSEGDA